MIALSQQLDLARKELDKRYPDLSLSPQPHPPLPFPDGWRIPYSLYWQSPTGAFRLRRTMLILFFERDDMVHPSVEWSELDDVREGEVRAEKLRRFQAHPALQFKLLSRGLEEIHLLEPASQIESLEMVLGDDTGEWLPCWRAGVRKSDATYRVVLVKPEGNPLVQTAQAFSSRKPPWVLDLARRYKNATLEARLEDKANGPWPVRRAQLVTWACLLKAEDFFRALGYLELDLHHLRVQYGATVDRGGRTDCVDGVPVITMGYMEGFGEAPDYFFHELGHAIWYLFYTRPPSALNKYDATVRTWTAGIQEGFADYLAAILRDDADKEKPIGSYLPGVVRKKYENLAVVREFTAACSYPKTTDDQYAIGIAWTNILWNLRDHLLKKGRDEFDVDRLIFSAHLRPRSDAQATADTFACYLESIRRTAAVMGIDLAGWCPYTLWG